MRALSDAAAEMGIPKDVPVTPYPGRHGGASQDAADGRTPPEIQRDGRWGGPSSVRRYEKRGRVQETFTRLFERSQKFCQEAARHLVFAVVSGRGPTL